MSASQDKKTRTQQRAEGTERRQVAAQKKAAEQRKSRARWIAGTIAVILLIAAILIGNSSLFYRQKALSVAGEDFSVAEVNYYYNVAYQNFYSQYGDYISMFGLDTSKALDKQEYTVSDEYDTWADYFTAEAKESIEQITALSKAAADAGLALTEEEQAQIDEQIESIGTYAQSAGYASAAKYLEAIYGHGVTEKLVREQMAKSILASNFATQQQESYTYTADALKEEYAEHASEYDLFSLRYYLVAAETEETTDDDGNATSAPTDETMAAAKKVADQIADAVQGTAGDDEADEAQAGAADLAAKFDAAVAEYGTPVPVYDDEGNETGETTPAEATTMENAAGSNLSYLDIADWAYDDARTAGDIGVVEAEGSGYYVVLFEDRDNNTYNTVSVRHILIQAVDADEDGTFSDEEKAAALEQLETIRDEWESGEQTEARFAELAEQYSEDTGSNTNGGLYENIYKGQMVQEFNDFCFADGRKAGDVEIVYGETSSYAGYHLVYFVGEGQAYCDYIADQLLRSEDYNAWQEELMADYEATEHFAIRYVG